MRIPPSSFALSLSFTRAPRKLPPFNRLRTLCPKQPRCTQDHSQSGTPSAVNAPSFAIPFTLLPCAATHLPSFQSFPHSLQKHRGCTPERNPLSPCRSSLSPRTNPERPLHPQPHGGTISSVIGLSGSSVLRETFPLVPVSKIQERTTGSTARLIQQSARDRRPGPLAIRGRHPALPFLTKGLLEGGRPGKASSVRLGSIVGP